MWEIGDIGSNMGLFFLLFLRSLGVLTLAPAFGGRHLPIIARIGLSLGLAGFVLPLLLETNIQPASGMPMGFALQCLGEFATGAILGFMANLTFVALQVAGQLIDIEMGLGIVSLLDMDREGRAPVVGTLLNLLALALFLEMRGHHAVFGAFWETFDLIPPGSLVFGSGLGDLAVSSFAGMFLVAVKISVPVVAALFLATLGLGVVARTVPQLNVFIVGLPLKAMLGSILIWLALPLYVRLAGRLIEDMPVFLMRVLTVWKG